MVRLFCSSALAAAGLAASPALAQAAPADEAVRVHASLGCLAAAIYHEARSEPDAGQRAVAQVVMNRLRHPAYPKTVCDVVLQGAKRTTGCQFTFTCDGSLARRPEPIAWQKAMDIAADALAGRGASPVGEATHYHTTAIRPYWAPSLTRVATLGSHIFYAGGPGGRRAANASGPRRQPGEPRVSVVYAEAAEDVAGAAVKVHRGAVPRLGD
jgi:spore germination cell wall hydrolase CwlJ-like protein